MSTLDARARSLQPAVPMGLLRSALPFVVAVGLAILLQVAVKPLLGDYWAKIALDIFTNVILAVSLTMVNGFTGQFSIGHAAFMAVGAYTAACLVYYTSFRIYGDASVHGGSLSTMLGEREVPFLTGGDGLFVLALLAGGVTAAVCGYVVGLPSLRLKGDYLAIVTLGFGEIVRVLIQQTSDTLYDPAQIAATSAWKFPKYIGGGLGFSGLPFYSSLFWAGLFAFITLIVAYRLKESTHGRAFISIREDEIAAEAMGVHTTKYKVRAFVIAAFFAGIAGGIFAHTNGVQLNPGELGFMKSFDIIIMVVLGGLGSISGASIAAAILSILSELLRDPPSVWPAGLVLGAIAAGIASLFTKKHQRHVAVTAVTIAVWELALFTVIAAGILAVVAGISNGWTWALIIGAACGGVCAAVARNRLVPFIVVAGILLFWETIRLLAQAAGVDLSEYRMVIYALLLIAMMILRPQGLLGIKELWTLWRERDAKKEAP